MYVPDLIDDARPAAIASVGIITTTRYCWAGCAFCRLAQPLARVELRRAPPGLSLSALHDAAVDWSAVSEVRVRGGLSLREPFEYWLHLLRAVKALFPGRITAFSPVEVWQFHQLEDRTVREIVRQLRWAGVDALGPGGSEYWQEGLRLKWSPYRITPEDWLEVARLAVEAGLAISVGPLVDPDNLWPDWYSYWAPLGDLPIAQVELKPLNSENTRLSVLGNCTLIETVQAVHSLAQYRPNLPILVDWPGPESRDVAEVLGASGASAIRTTGWEIQP
jgi:hypothetical protein